MPENDKFVGPLYFGAFGPGLFVIYRVMLWRTDRRDAREVEAAARGRPELD